MVKSDFDTKEERRPGMNTLASSESQASAGADTIHNALLANAKMEAASHAPKGLVAAGIVIHEWRGFMANEPPSFDWILQDVIAKGMKGDLNAKSKQWKSFFGIQLALCVSSGQPFLNMRTPHARRCAYFNLELIERGIWERGTRMEAAMDAKPTGDMLYIANLRGRADQLRSNETALVSEVQRLGIDLVILDPRYKLIRNGEDENMASGLRGVLDFRDKLANVAAVLVIGHDTKGDTAGKSMADRGAGSYTAGADYDFSFALSPHAEAGYSVLSTSCRYRKSPPDLTIQFDDEQSIFEAIPDIPATIKLSRRQNGDKHSMSDVKLQQEAAFEDAVCKFASSHDVISKGTFDIEIGNLPEAKSIGEKKRDKIIKSLFEKHLIARTDKWEVGNDGRKRKVGGRNYMVGTPDKVKKYEDDFRTLGT